MDELVCSNHSVCQKRKAENECFLETARYRFSQTLQTWKLSDELRFQILSILELLLTEERQYISSDSTDTSYCNEIRLLNEFQKLQFFKASYFLESLEKSQLSAVHLLRIQTFLETKIFNHLPIKEFFDEIRNMETLYECKNCKTIAPLDASIEEISKLFYTSVRHKCKECFKVETRERYAVRKAEKEKTAGPMIKMYLCMKCGEDNFINFYERNKSKCKFCILQEKRGIYGKASGEESLAPSASKPHHCRVCHTEDPKNFRETYKSICYACFLIEKKAKYEATKTTNGRGETTKPYFCNDCETDDPSKFRRGYKSQCYECFLKAKKTETIQFSEGKSIIPSRKVLCKYCEDTDPRNFTEGMETVCARCEEIEMQTYICKACGLECLRSCFTEEELAKPDYDKTCNDCDPEAFKSSQRKPWKCLGCGESSGANFYPGFRSKCKVCTREERRQKYEMRERMLKPFLCTDCGTEIPTDFYPGHKTRCKRCL